jgi:hypothetical protein
MRTRSSSLLLRPAFNPPPQPCYTDLVNILLSGDSENAPKLNSSTSGSVTANRTVRSEEMNSSRNSMTFSKPNTALDEDQLSSKPSLNSRLHIKEVDPAICLFEGAVVVNSTTINPNTKGTASTKSTPSNQHNTVASRTTEPKRPNQCPQNPPDRSVAHTSSSSASRSGTIDVFFSVEGRPSSQAGESPSSSLKRPRPADQVHHDTSNRAPASKTQATRSSSHSLTHQHVSPSLTLATTSDIYTGLSSVSRNIAASARSMSGFETLFDRSLGCALTVLWPDGSSAHSTTSSRFCTPSGTVDTSTQYISY